jgi:hypothetical protein
MRFLDGLLAIGIWIIILIWVFKMGVEISNEIVVLSTAIVYAGALAGGN